MDLKSVITGAAGAIAVRSMLPRLLKLKFDRDVAKLNAGDYEPLLAAYDEDAVLRFNDGDHRWSGTWSGKRAIDVFLRNFTAARVQGRIREIAISGPPWALRLFVRFDDYADTSDGERLYENRTVLVFQTRWGRLIDQEDFYVDTGGIELLERRLAERGVEAIPKPG